MPITETALVIRVKKDIAFVEITKKEKCNGCKVCSFGKKNTLIVPAYLQQKCETGDTVSVEMPEKAILSAPIIMYFIPLAMFFLGLLIGNFIGNELIMFLCACIGIAIGFLLVYLADKLFYKNKNVMPRVINVLEKNTKEFSMQKETKNSEEKYL